MCTIMHVSCDTLSLATLIPYLLPLTFVALDWICQELSRNCPLSEFQWTHDICKMNALHYLILTELHGSAKLSSPTRYIA